jgi:hypothetical protein
MPSPQTVSASQINFLRTSASCATGAVVVFTSIADARVLTVARAADGNIAGISFTVLGILLIGAQAEPEVLAVVDRLVEQRGDMVVVEGVEGVPAPAGAGEPGRGVAVA